MTLHLKQLEPGPEVLQMGIDALIAGLEARKGGTWHVVSLPDALKRGDLMDESQEPWLTKTELAEMLRVSPRTITRLNPPHTRVGGQNRYRLSEVEAALNGVPEKGGNVISFPGNNRWG